MRLLGEQPKTTIELIWGKPVAGQRFNLSSQLRGAVSNAFPGYNYFHQHDENGKVIYRYPQVQYRWQNGCGVIIGWKNAAKELPHFSWLDLNLNHNNEIISVTDLIVRTSNSKFGISDRLLHYSLRSPLLLFNQINYKKYQKLNLEERLYEQDRLLQSQILIALRGMDIVFADRLYATFTFFKTVKCNHKGQTLMGILGKFATNAYLPDGFAVGHAVSHGYGWIDMVQNQCKFTYK